MARKAGEGIILGSAQSQVSSWVFSAQTPSASLGKVRQVGPKTLIPYRNGYRPGHFGSEHREEGEGEQPDLVTALVSRSRCHLPEADTA